MQLHAAQELFVKQQSFKIFHSITKLKQKTLNTVYVNFLVDMRITLTDS